MICLLRKFRAAIASSTSSGRFISAEIYNVSTIHTMLSFTSFNDSFNEYGQIKGLFEEENLDEPDKFKKETTKCATFSKQLKTFCKKITVEPVTFFYACALILHAPLIQQYIYHVTSIKYGLPRVDKIFESSCEAKTELESSPMHHIRNEVQSITSYYYMGIILSAALPSLIMALFLGSWSDQVGRKVVIFLPILGGLLDTTCILITMFTGAPLYVLFVGSFLNGLCGFFTTMILAVFSYIADVTTEKERALRLGILEAVAFVSGMISHVTSGWWIHHFGFKAPYMFIFVLHFISLTYVVVFLPNTKPQGAIESQIRVKELFSLIHLKKVFKVFKEAQCKFQLIGLLLSSAVMMISNIGFGSVIVLFALDTPFCLSSIMIGYFLADCMLMQAIGAIFALTILQRCFSELILTQVGFLSSISSLILIALINRRWELFLVPTVGLFGGVCMPIIRAQMSKLVHPDDQGALFAAVATLETLCTLIGAAIFNLVYPYSVKELNFKGLCFLIMAALQLIPAIIIIFLGIPRVPEKQSSKNWLKNCGETLAD